MNLDALPRTATLAILIAAGMTVGAVAQSDDEEDSYDKRSHRMMEGMGERSMMGMHGRRGAHPRVMMKIMFTVADTNGDGALSFEEVSAIHRRVFDGADTNKDGRLTREEI